MKVHLVPTAITLLACIAGTSNAQLCGAWKRQHGDLVPGGWTMNNTTPQIADATNWVDAVGTVRLAVLTGEDSATLPDGAPIPSGRSNRLFFFDGVSWSAAKQSPTLALGTVLATIGNKLYVLGAEVTAQSAFSFGAYDISTDTWSDLPPPATPNLFGPTIDDPRYTLVTATYRGKLIVAVPGAVFTSTDIEPQLWEWDGSNWSVVATGFNENGAVLRPFLGLRVIDVDGTGPAPDQLVVTGDFKSISTGTSTINARNVVILTATPSGYVPSALPPLQTFCLENSETIERDSYVVGSVQIGSDLVVAGRFNKSGGTALGTVASISLTSPTPAWSTYGPYSTETTGAIEAVDGNVYIATQNFPGNQGEFPCFTVTQPNLWEVKPNSRTRVNQPPVVITPGDPDAPVPAIISQDPILRSWTSPSGLPELVILNSMGANFDRPPVTAGRYSRWAVGTAAMSDFNNNDVFPDDQDAFDFFSVLAGEPCPNPNGCNSIDINNNGVFPEDQDVIDFFNAIAGLCPQ